VEKLKPMMFEWSKKMATQGFNKRKAGWSTSKEGDDEEMEEEVQSDDEEAFATLEDTVLFAKPSTLPASINIGGPTQVPNLPEIVFPYFEGMIVSDKTTIRSITSSRFLRLFGENTNDIKAAYSKFRREIDSFSSTRVGLFFAHILFGSTWL